MSEAVVAVVPLGFQAMVIYVDVGYFPAIASCVGYDGALFSDIESFGIFSSLASWSYRLGRVIPELGFGFVMSWSVDGHLGGYQFCDGGVVDDKFEWLVLEIFGFSFSCEFDGELRWVGIAYGDTSECTPFCLVSCPVSNRFLVFVSGLDNGSAPVPSRHALAQVRMAVIMKVFPSASEISAFGFNGVILSSWNPLGSLLQSTGDCLSRFVCVGSYVRVVDGGAGGTGVDVAK